MAGVECLLFSCGEDRVPAMSTKAKAQAILDEIKALPPEDLQAVGAEVSQLLARAAGGEPGAALGRVLRAEPPGGHPGGSLEPDDPFFQILQKIEEERHRRFPRPPPVLDR